MSVELRPIRDEEWAAFAIADGTAFGFTLTPDALEAVASDRRTIDLERTLASFDGEEIVSTTAIFTFDVSVPGGRLPTAGVTWVSVKPTHRRQGHLRNMMSRQLRDVRERGEPLAALWASESIIYGRFGYGIAAEGVDIKIDRARTELRHVPEAKGRTRLITREQALAVWPAVYDKAMAQRPGFYSRDTEWWEHHSLRQREWDRGGGWSDRFYVQYEEDGEPLGYARYRSRGGRDEPWPHGTLGVQEMIATTDAAYGALWSYLFGVDLMAEITAQRRAIEEPLYWMLADPRRLVRRPYDSLWVRVVDVASALEGRRYAAEGRVVFEVRDDFCDWVAGRYELEAGPDGARCKRTDASADVTLSAAELGAAYLGGMRLSTMQAAGRVEGDRNSVARADAMLRWDPVPWCPEVF
jgi:predicted acetyltransferase